MTINSEDLGMYDEAVKLIKRAGKFEKKDNTDKAVKLYKQAFNKLEKANKKDKDNPNTYFGKYNGSLRLAYSKVIKAKEQADSSSEAFEIKNILKNMVNLICLKMRG